MKFAQPAWLILLVLLPLLGAGAVAMAHLRRKQWAEFIAPRLRPSLLKRSSPLPRWFSLLFLYAGCAAIIIALARPSGDAGPRTEKSLGRNVLIALDLSRSMRVSDVKPDRLAQAKIVIYELLEAMPNERIGLLGFAGAAYEFAPLTVDHGAVRETVEQLDETWAPLGGSNLAEVVRLATDTLKKTGQKNNALVIISDGEQNDGDLEDMIAEAKHSGVFILSIGVGTEDGDYVPNADFAENRMMDRSGKPIISRLQADVMRELAQKTRGQYAAAGSGADIPAMVKSAIKDMDAFEMEGRERTVAMEFYQWLLLPAIVFLLASIIAAARWKGVGTAAAVMAMILTTNPAQADDVSAAKDELQRKNYPEAMKAYRKLAEKSSSAQRKPLFHLGEATAAYRGGDYRAARSAFSQSLLSNDPATLTEGHLGMGLSLFQIGWMTLTNSPYPSAGEKTPNMEQFDSWVMKKRSELKEADPADQEGSDTTAPFRSLITNWADAVRHFDSALVHSPSNVSVRNNRETVMVYLNRLRELLEQEEQQTEQSMPQPQPQQGEPKEGETGDEQPKEEPGEDPGDSKPDDSGENGDDPKNSESKSGDDKEKSETDQGKKKEDNKEGKAPKPKPGETPEEQAQRLLKENADLEKGPLTPGRREFRRPQKDW